MGSAQGRSSQTHARRRHRHAATSLPVPAPVPVPVPRQPAPIDEKPGEDEAAGHGGLFVEPGDLAVDSATLARSCAAVGYVMAGLAGFLPPLLIVLLSRRDSAFLRKHAVQAMNAAFTMLLYGLSAAIIAGLLALDSWWLGLGIGLAAVAACWLVTFGYLIAAMIAACRGRFYQIPSWLCAQLLRP
jgi:uncharacterized Tic20 family protein